MMQLPPRINGPPPLRDAAAAADVPSDAASAATNWQAERTKQRPSQAMCRMVGIHVSRSSTVGAQYSSTPLAYMVVRKRGM